MLRCLLTGVFLLTFCLLKITVAEGQVTDTTHPVSVDPELLAIQNSKTPKEYTLAGLKITGSKFLDESLLISVSGLSIGDKIIIPRPF